MGKVINIGYFANVFFEGLWFLTTLFVLSVIGLLFERKLKSPKLFYLGWFVFYSVIYLLPDFWIFDHLEFLTPFFVLGIILRKIRLNELPWKVLFASCVIFIVTFHYYDFSCSLYELSNNPLNLEYLYKTILRILGGTSGIFLTFFVVRSFTKLNRYPKEFLSKIGFVTLPIYVLHQKLLMINMIFHIQIFYWIILFCLTVFFMYASMIAYKIIRQNKYLGFLLFGEYKNG